MFKSVPLKLKGSDVISVAIALANPRFANMPGKAAFNYAMGRNREAFIKVAKMIEEARTYPPELEKFIAARDEIGLKFAVRDSKTNEPVAAQNGMLRIADGPAYKAAIDAYASEHADESAKVEKIEADFKALTEAEHEVKAFKVKIDDFPDSIPGNIFDGLLLLIDDPSDSQVVNEPPQPPQK